MADACWPLAAEFLLSVGPFYFFGPKIVAGCLGGWGSFFAVRRKSCGGPQHSRALREVGGVFGNWDGIMVFLWDVLALIFAGTIGFIGVFLGWLDLGNWDGHPSCTSWSFGLGVNLALDAMEEFFDDVVNLDEFLVALDVFVKVGVFEVFSDGFLDGLGMFFCPFAGGVFGNAEVLGDLRMGGAGRADADEGVEGLLVMFHSLFLSIFK